MTTIVTPPLSSQGPAPPSAAVRPTAPSVPFWQKLLAVTAVVVAIAAAWLARDVLLLVFGGILLAVFLSGLARIAARYTGLSQGWSLALVLFLLAMLVALAVAFLGAEIAAQFQQLSQSLTDSLAALRKRLMETPLRNVLRRPEDSGLFQFLGQWAGILATGLGMLLAPLAVLMIGIYLAIDPHSYRRGLLALVPRQRQGRAEQIMHEACEALWHWLWGRLFSMTLIGVVTGVGLWLLGIPMYLSLAIIAFATNFVPYIGPLMSAVPAVLVALSVSPTTAAYVLLLYGGIQLVETYLITPLVEQEAVHLPPAFTLAVEMTGGALLGGLGVLFATPLAAVAIVMINTLYVEDALGKDADSQA